MTWSGPLGFMLGICAMLFVMLCSAIYTAWRWSKGK